jgi:uncharacterized RDD family membrane protein YckC
VTATAPSPLPAPSTQPRELADCGQRFVAALVDGALYSLCLIVGFRIARPFFAASGTMLFRAEQELALMVSTLPLLVYQWRLIARTGQSIGKRWRKIEIVCIAGPPSPGWLHGVVLREWVLHGLFILSYIFRGVKDPSGWLSLVIYLPIFLKDRRCLHDYIAGTQVVRVAGDASDGGSRG